MANSYKETVASLSRLKTLLIILMAILAAVFVVKTMVFENVLRDISDSRADLFSVRKPGKKAGGSSDLLARQLSESEKRGITLNMDLPRKLKLKKKRKH
ncbi:MAG: hypothetical protein ACE5GM_03730 [bacterium]